MIRRTVLGAAICIGISAAAQSATQQDIAQAQRHLNKLGFDAGIVDGLWGDATKRALEAFLAETGNTYDGELDGDELRLLEQELTSRGLSVGPTVDWEYRATSIAFGGYEFADQPVYEAIKTIREIPAYGFNVVTLDFRCVGKADLSAPESYPLGRRIGCSIANKQILKEEGFVSTRRDATSLAIDEAIAAGLAVNLKPMFHELGRRFGNADASGYGTVPLDIFFDGDGKTWSGYVPTILAVARYAQENGVAYLTIGTELNNLNSKIEEDRRWPEIIASVREVFDGQIIYATNYNNDSNLRGMSKSNVMRNVDIVGLNFFPSRMMGGREDYTAEEVAIAFHKAKSKNGRNMIGEGRRLQEQLNVPIILSETIFPTWRGSANWIFRGTCDYENKRRSGWAYTKGPLQAKTPSDEHGQTLAQGFMYAFEDEDWVHGADYLYWAVAHAYDARTDTQQYGPCSSWLWDDNTGIKGLIKKFHDE
ncbi:glycoside hydrolase family 113 [Ruegeria arenilitoris]|uniref:glycoside hydrolase family 113 n=1 Tax=Ruegeria arenilitoris TaxID=1173585 RepID=UPI00148046E1